MAEQLHLITFEHPEAACIGATHVLDPAAAETVVGRLPVSGLRLDHASISRHHAAFEHDGQQWLVRDLGSRHGTFVDGQRIDPHTAHAVRPGTRLGFGPIVLRVGTSERAEHSMVTLDDGAAPGAQVSIVPASQLRGLAQTQLDELIRAAVLFSQAVDLDTLAEEVARAVARGTGAGRAMLLKPGVGDEEFTMLAGHGVRPDALSVSRSLVRSALEGHLARLEPDAGGLAGAQSIVDLGIGSAIAAPVRFDEAVEAVLYLDTRGQERAFDANAAAYAEALSGFCGLAMANLRRQEVEGEQRRLRQDLDTAREAQEMLMPSASGEAGPVRFHSVSLPGRHVSGDLLDMISIDEDRAIVMLGDVSGKGVGAAVLMAATQSYLRACAAYEDDPSSLLAKLNDQVCAYSRAGAFVTMCLAVVDRRSDHVMLADAGHAHWILIPRVGAPEPIEIERQMPLGIADGITYPKVEAAFESGARLLMFSDGLVEQFDDSNEQFGMARVLEVVAASDSAQGDVERLVAALHDHAGGSPFADDLTIASFERL